MSYRDRIAWASRGISRGSFDTSFVQAFWFAATIFICIVANSCRADDSGTEFFEKRIRPVLTEHCSECHSADAKKVGGNLLLDSHEGVARGGESGPVIEPRDPDKSLLIKAVRYTDDTIKMPPKGKLPAAAIADLEEWVRMGAPDPRDKPITLKPASTWEENLRTRRDWWSLKPVQDPPIPAPKDSQWSDHAIDRFILATLEEHGLMHTAATTPRTFARRLSLVLTGLPANLELVEQFARECGEVEPSGLPAVAVERLVNVLLESSHFGERWARHWMDVVRFTETHGNEWNYEVHHAWRYRDYLIRALNADVPFDQFVREHIAGDLLPRPRWNEAEQFNESVIATAFYRFGEVNHDDCIALRELGYDLLDNQIDTLTKAFQATTVACARCHDHKLDAVSMQDYYGLLGILRSSRLVSHTIDAPSANAALKQRLRELKPELRRELAKVWREDAVRFDRYMTAATTKKLAKPDADERAKDLDSVRLEKWVAVLAADKYPADDPFDTWRKLVSSNAADSSAVQLEWKKLAEKQAQDEKNHQDFNSSQFLMFADFRKSAPQDWQVGGQGLAEGASASGDFAIHPEGPAVVKSIFPAGHFTNILSEKLNGTLRSSILPVGKKHLSVQVIGQRSSAVRLVSNNCQLNYSNYKALTSPDWQWKTFTIPEDRESLRTYAELMTMFDNPKFPDQLSGLGGDSENYKLPWEKAAANPRSWFGVTQVVLHDGGEAPRPELGHLRRLFASGDVGSLAEVSELYAKIVSGAINAWAEDRASDDDVRWLAVLIRRELIGNRVDMSPQVQSLVDEYRRVESQLASPRVTPGIADGGPGIDQPVFTRGDCRRPGEPAKRRFLEVLANSTESFASPGSGRLELAQRIASPSNPLTARVIVNRVWHHLFGTGLVQSVDDFGHVGDLPSHPELLDHLASHFVRDGWSIKQLVRSIVMTRTFQQSSSQTSLAAREIDPQNRWLWHYPARRMEAEAIRDSILAVSGRLNPQVQGASVQPFRERENSDRRLFPGPLDGDGRRSVYIKQNLMESPRFLSAFNYPGGKVAQGRRDLTNVPAQALALLNDPFVLQQANVWASRVVLQTNDSVESRIESMFRTAFQRTPTSEERQRFAQATLQFAELAQVPAAEMLTNPTVWKDVAHAFFNLQEFIFIP